MALSPSIPTSFVPKQPEATPSRRSLGSGSNLLLIVGSSIFIMVLVIAAAEFLYVQFLKNVENAKASQILAAQNNVSEDTVNNYIRLDERLTAGEMLLNQHVALTQFFNLLESITVQTVHFDGVSIVVADDRSAQITMTGEAKDFNALANQSTIFANQKLIKNAIFSDIGINKDNSVSFSLTADLDPALVIESVPIGQQSAPVFSDASSSASSTASSAVPAKLPSVVIPSIVPGIPLPGSSTTSATTSP